MDKGLAHTIGKAIFYSSIQFSIGSVALSSAFSVRNFCKEQEILENAIFALKEYLVIGILWMIGTMLVLWSNSGICGLITGFVFNMIIIAWIWITYQKAFKEAARKHGLKVPSMW